ncbi:DinB family protein [Mucilaginibacter ginsenosidivorax]|uniref:DinB family protein n=1 Tax=Mucilaginibacter ginsenosidivorax TaxID=862126 RepID=A0A5B8WCY9_9SPHI|nr:DinB family protein [Mucilaginibacter ginsenosidivorax]QEC79798.1 DinB family protein [Mucilaginibacter ginsenosidivorax]
MIKIGRPYIEDAPSWYPYFFDLAEGDDLIEALEINKQQTINLIRSIPASAENHSYAEGKWTVKQVFIHLNDDERYYAYKAFCCTRRVNAILELPQGEDYNKDFNAQNRTLTDIADEFIIIRDATISLYKHMTDAMLDFKFDNTPVYTARSVGWMVVGHNVHHHNLLKERYGV